MLQICFCSTFQICWVGQKVHSGLSIGCYRKIQVNLLVNQYNTVLLAIITVCTFIRKYSPSNWKLILHFPHIQALGNHHSTLPLLSLTSLLLLLLFKISHISEAMYYMSFSLWLILPSIVPSRPILVVTNGRISSFLMTDSYALFMCIESFLYIPLSMGTWVVSVILAIVDHAWMNMGMHTSLSWCFHFLQIKIKSGMAGSYGSCIFSSLRNLHTVLHSGCPNLHSHHKCRRVPFSPHPHPHLSPPVFLVKAMLTGMKQYLTEVHFCLGDICWGIRHHPSINIMGRIFRKWEILGCPEGELSILWEEDQSIQKALISSSS